jgi:potassium/hydrogen antiporter
MFTVDRLLLIGAVLLLLGIASSKFSARIGLPVLVLFLGVGMLAGSEGLGGIEFENYALAHGVGTAALAIILFDGGLRTSLGSIRLAWKPALLLATAGVLVTALITGLAAHWILDLSLLEGILLGGIVGSTDAAAVFAVLRSSGLRLENRLSATLEIESASNDPMAIFLTIGILQVLLGRMTLGADLLSLFAVQMLVGTALGLAVGWLAAHAINRIQLSAAGMYPLIATGFGLLAYGAAAFLGGSGFLAVYLAGIVLGNRRVVFQRGIFLFHDAAAWLAQIAMFVVLGLLSFPSRLIDVAPQGLAIAAVLILLARPISVLVTLLPFRFDARQLGFLSWVGLKGAVPITLATFPLLLGYPGGPLIFDVVFFVVLASAVVQGPTLAPVARRLGLERPPEPEAPVSLEITSLRDVDADIVEYTVAADSRAAGHRIRELALPEGVVIALIARADRMIPPQGSTHLLENDHVFAVLRRETRPLVDRVFGRDRSVEERLTGAEFPIRAAATVEELEEFYGIALDAPPECTLAALLHDRLPDDRIVVGSRVVLGAVALTIRQLDDGGAIERVGLALLALDDAAGAEPDRPAPATRPAAEPSDTVTPPGSA